MQHFFTPSVSAYSILAVLGWLAGIALVLLDLLVFATDDLGHLGLLVVAGSAVLNVRGFIHRLECREKAAFDFGRDSVRPVR